MPMLMLNNQVTMQTVNSLFITQLQFVRLSSLYSGLNYFLRCFRQHANVCQIVKCSRVNISMLTLTTALDELVQYHGGFAPQSR